MSSDDSSDTEKVHEILPMVQRSFIRKTDPLANFAKMDSTRDDVFRSWADVPETNLFFMDCSRGQNTLIESPEERINLLQNNPDEKSANGSFCSRVKMFILTCCWVIFTVILISTGPKKEIFQNISISSSESEQNPLFLGAPSSDEISIVVEGPLLPETENDDLNPSRAINHLSIWLNLWTNETSISDTKKSKNISKVWTVPLLPSNFFDIFPSQQRRKTFRLNLTRSDFEQNNILAMNFQSTFNESLSFFVGYDFFSIDPESGIIYAAILLAGVYVFIIFEMVHRTLAAVMASTMSIALLAMMNQRPTMYELLSWMDFDTLLLLFSMMILVAIFADTGIFDYLAVYAFKITGGEMWPLINTLCLFTVVFSAFLDNVTTILLMTPVTIRLCEVMELNPVPVLTMIMIYGNAGGAMTPVGDPPNVIISSNPAVTNAGVDFGVFTLHMTIGSIIVLVLVHFQLRFIFRDPASLRFDEPHDVQELRHEISIWEKTAASLTSYSKDESLVRETLTKKVQLLSTFLIKKLANRNPHEIHYKSTLEELEDKYPIRDKFLLVKSGCAFVFVIVFFFLHSLPRVNLSLGTTALLGAILMLILTDAKDMDALMARVEWSTLLFFASLFILMEALSRLGLITWIGKQTEKVILSVDEDSRLTVAILLLLWVSAFASAFVDNVPLTTMMVRIATNLADDQGLGLPLQPLIWALAFGACMGGNGTLIGSTSNVVCAGVAAQHGYRITFMQFFKIGFPILLSSTGTITLYLITCHIIFNWNGTS